MSQDDRRVAINISGIPVAGIGGLGLVAMAVLVSVVMPAARWTMVAGLAGGVVLAAVLIVARRHITVKGPSGDDPRILFRAVPPGLRSDGVRRRSSDTDESVRLRLLADPVCPTRWVLFLLFGPAPGGVWWPVFTGAPRRGSSRAPRRAAAQLLERAI